VLEDTQYLILERKPAGVYVQVAARDGGGLRVEAVSNHYLEGDERLDRAQIRRLKQLGWLAPTYVPDQPRKTRRTRKGSPNYYRYHEGEVDYAAVAGMLVATLREVYNVSRPSRLAYAAFDAKSRVILLPTLGIDLKPRSAKRPEAPAQCRPKSPDELRAAVLAAIREFTGKSDLRLVLKGAEPSLELLEALNERNNKSRFVMLTLKDSDIMAYVGVDAKLFVPEILTRALSHLADTSASTGKELKQRFAGLMGLDDEPAPRPDATPEAVN
jgi:hypothetical protein